MNDDYEEYDVEVKPNHSTAYAGLILAALSLFGGVLMLANTNTAIGASIGQALLVGGVVGVFLMLAAVAVVTAIYRQRDL